MSKLMSKLLKSTKLDGAAIMSESKILGEKDSTPTSIPALNIALSGDVDGGLRSGILTIAGNSRHFKTSYALLIAAAYLDKHEDAVMLFYDSEFSNEDYLKSFGINADRVLHIPVMNIEQLQFDLAKKFDDNNPDGIKRGDKVIIVVDSIGNLASVKEAENAVNEHSAADVGVRAKSLKSMFRIITPHLTMKNVAMIVIAHIYTEMKMYGKDIISGGSGILLSSDAAWIIGRSQEKDGADLVGYNFNINIEKSRYVREKSKIPILVKFDGGISKYTGLLDIALESGIIVKPKVGWYAMVDMETGEVSDKNFRAADFETEERAGKVVADPFFKKWVKERYGLTHGKMLAEAEAHVDADTED